MELVSSVHMEHTKEETGHNILSFLCDLKHTCPEVPAFRQVLFVGFCWKCILPVF